MAKLIRLQKMLSDCGVASRRKSEDLIRLGKVKVNGKIAQIGDKVDPFNDKVYVQGKRVTASAKPKYRYIMLNKPRGYITSVSDDRGRKTVMELLKDVSERVYPVGRLDKESEGLLLLTNDGEFANTITHPRKHINKVYRVSVRPNIDDTQVKKLSEGVVIDGKKTLPAQIRIVKREQDKSVLEIVIREGRNRQIRRMCEAVGLDVTRLKRTQEGTVKLGKLKLGDHRDLTEDEVKRLLSDSNIYMQEY